MKSLQTVSDLTICRIRCFNLAGKSLYKTDTYAVFLSVTSSNGRQCSPDILMKVLHVVEDINID